MSVVLSTPCEGRALPCCNTSPVSRSKTLTVTGESDGSWRHSLASSWLSVFAGVERNSFVV